MTLLTDEEDRELRRQFAEQQARMTEILDDLVELLAERKAKRGQR